MYYNINQYLFFYLNEIGFPHNYKVPIKSVALAAEQDYSKAQHNIAYIHYNGHYSAK